MIFPFKFSWEINKTKRYNKRDIPKDILRYAKLAYSRKYGLAQVIDMDMNKAWNDEVDTAKHRKEIREEVKRAML